MGASFAKVLARCHGKSESRVLLYGLDAAGKTTILYKLKLGEIVTTIPTIGFNVETVEFKLMSFTIWDLGLRDKARPLIRHYTPNTDGLIFVVDANDKDRIEDAREFLHYPLEDCPDIPILVFVNKTDLPGALGTDEVACKLGLQSARGHRRIHLQRCCASSGEGLYEGLAWLTSALQQGLKPSFKTVPSAVKPMTKARAQEAAKEVMKPPAREAASASKPDADKNATSATPIAAAAGPENDDEFLLACEEGLLPHMQGLDVVSLVRVAFLYRTRISGASARAVFEAMKCLGYIAHATRAYFWISRVYQMPSVAAGSSLEFLKLHVEVFPREESAQEVLILQSYTEDTLASSVSELFPAPADRGEQAGDFEDDDTFLQRVAEAQLEDGELASFRELLRLAFALLRRYPRREAIRRMDEVLKRLADGWTSPQAQQRCWRPFHDTRQYVAIQLAHAALVTQPDLQQAEFASMAATCPELLSEEVLSQYYSEEALRRGADSFVVPDLHPLPSVLAVPAQTWHSELDDAQFLSALRADSLPSLGSQSLARFAYLCLRQGRRQGLTELLAAVQRTREDFAGMNSKVVGFFAHETIAYFIMHMVHYTCVSQSWPLEHECFAKFVERCGYLLEPRLYRRYYSEALIHTKEARLGLVLPDLHPLPDVVSRKTV